MRIAPSTPTLGSLGGVVVTGAASPAVTRGSG